MPNFPVFLSYVLVSTFTPGPNNIMSMSNASRYGFRKSIMFYVGVFSGFAILMALSSIFGVTLYKLLPFSLHGRHIIANPTPMPKTTNGQTPSGRGFSCSSSIPRESSMLLLRFQPL